jgi:uncharacterized membrane protein
MMHEQTKNAPGPADTWTRVASMLSSFSVSEMIVPGLILLSLAITIPLALILNVWIDEAYTLVTTGKGIGYALGRALHFELQPPVYFVLLNLWRSLGGSPFFARLFSVLCVVLTIAVVAKLSRRYFKDVHPGWITAAVALNPFIIWASVEIRMYAFVILLSSLLLLFFYDGYLCLEPKRRARWYYMAISIVALYTQYYLGFLLAACAFSLLALRRWRALRDYIVGMMLVGILFAPMLFILREQLQSHANTISRIDANISLLDGIKFVYKRTLEYVLPGNWENVLSLKLLRNWIFRVGIIYGLFFVIKKNRRSIAPSNLAIMSIAFMLCLFFLMIRNIVGLGFLRIYHTAGFFLPTMLGVFSVMTAASSRKFLAVGTAIILFFSFAALSNDYAPMKKYGDWERVASYIMKFEKNGEPILIFRNEGVLPFKIYYSGLNRLVPVPDYPNQERYDLREQGLQDEGQIIKALSKVSGNVQRAWLITVGTAPYLGNNFHVEVLENFVSKYYSVVDEKRFFKAEVRLLEKKNVVSRK